MKRIVFLSLFVAISAAAFSQADTAATQRQAGAWTTTTNPALKASEFMFKNWSSSGNSQIDVTGTFFGNYKYKHPKYVWDNIVDLAYGYAWQDLDNSDSVGGLFETRRKSNDKIDLTSALSWNAYKGWGASFTANLKTQFGAGYVYDGIGAMADSTKKQVSGFFAPAYLTTALSFEHKKDNWSVSLSFLTGKTTFVCNKSLIDSGYTYGVIQKYPDDPLKYTYSYFGLGSYVKAQYLKKDIVKNLDLYARFELFYDYRKPGTMKWDDIANTDYRGYEYANNTLDQLTSKKWLARRAFESDLDFELKLDYRLSSHVAANFALNMKWDTDFSGWGDHLGHWQLYQMAGIQVFFKWQTPKS
ncbi:MAG: DUF3078 domain-containing protein [Bacteroidales bacterium]|nr:DUF3078 domain-containing protein [Bacteroidales bacterium]